MCMGFLGKGMDKLYSFCFCNMVFGQSWYGNSTLDRFRQAFWDTQEQRAFSTIKLFTA